jgi:hypothetical protein
MWVACCFQGFFPPLWSSSWCLCLMVPRNLLNCHLQGYLHKISPPFFTFETALPRRWRWLKYCDQGERIFNVEYLSSLFMKDSICTSNTSNFMYPQSIKNCWQRACFLMFDVEWLPVGVDIFNFNNPWTQYFAVNLILNKKDSFLSEGIAENMNFHGIPLPTQNVAVSACPSPLYVLLCSGMVWRYLNPGFSPFVRSVGAHCSWEYHPSGPLWQGAGQLQRCDHISDVQRCVRQVLYVSIVLNVVLLCSCVCCALCCVVQGVWCVV